MRSLVEFYCAACDGAERRKVRGRVVATANGPMLMAGYSAPGPEWETRQSPRGLVAHLADMGTVTVGMCPVHSAGLLRIGAGDLAGLVERANRSRRAIRVAVQPAPRSGTLEATIGVLEEPGTGG